MNCDNCKSLDGITCKLGKLTFLNPIIEENPETGTNKIVKLGHQCIFKNTQYDLNYEETHNFAKTHIAIAAYIKIDNEDTSIVSLLADAEKQFEKNLIGQMNILVNFFPTLEFISNLTFQVQNINKERGRLWSVEVILDDAWKNNEFVDVPNFILDTCKLPYFCILNNPAQFAEIKNFEHFCMSNPAPNIYGTIKNTKYFRKLLESLDNVENQEEYTV